MRLIMLMILLSSVYPSRDTNADVFLHRTQLSFRNIVKPALASHPQFSIRLHACTVLNLLRCPTRDLQCFLSSFDQDFSSTSAQTLFIRARSFFASSLCIAVRSSLAARRHLFTAVFASLQLPTAA